MRPTPNALSTIPISGKRTLSALAIEHQRAEARSQAILAGGLRLRQDVDVPLRATSMRLGVQDALTGHMGTVEIPLPVKAPPEAAQSLAHAMSEIEPD
jgi:hypothetical protein